MLVQSDYLFGLKRSKFTMSNTPADILAAIETSPYEPSTASLLEKYVSTQLSTGTYDFFANKALLKNYQCIVNAATVKLEMICDVLVLSLMRLPSTDYLALSYLLPKIVDCEKFTLTQKYAEMLEKSQYNEIWAEYGVNAATFSNAKGFENAIRNCILMNVSATFRDIETSMLAPMLGLQGEKLKAFLATSPLIEKVTDNSIRFLPNDENQSGGGVGTQDNSRVLENMKKQLFTGRSVV